MEDDVIGIEQESLPAVVAGVSGRSILLGGSKRVIRSNGGMRNASGSAIIISHTHPANAGNATIFPLIIISHRSNHLTPSLINPPPLRMLPGLQ